MARKKGLGGQGVDVLFGDISIEEADKKLYEADIDTISVNRWQPRTDFNRQQLKELSDSIKKNGVLQPLIVTRKDSGKLSLIAGERRLRASKNAGLATVPVIEIEVDDEKSRLELALIENIQRTDLNAVEEAEAYKSLIENFGYTQEETAQRVGKKRTTVTNALRLLKLPVTILNDLKKGLLSEGHGRALIKLINDSEMLKEIRDKVVHESLSVRQTERLVKQLTTADQKKKNQPKRVKNGLSKRVVKTMTTELTNRFHSKIAINQNGHRGKIEIEYYSEDDLNRLYTLLLNE